MIYFLDIGGTCIKYAVKSENSYKIIFKVDNNFKTKDELKEYIYKHTKIFDTIIIGVAGFIKDSYLKKSPNISYLDNTNFISLFNNFKNIKVLNDVNMAIFSLDDIKDTVYITLGTGLGAAYYHNDLIVGYDGMALEIGHTYLKNEYNFLCNCNKRSCAETIVSKLGIINLLNYYSNEKKEYDIKEVFKNYNNNDLYKKVIDIFIDNLSIVIANILYTLNPKTVYLAGGITNSVFILDLINKNILKYITNEITCNIKISDDKDEAVLKGCLGYYRRFYAK